MRATPRLAGVVALLLVAPLSVWAGAARPAAPAAARPTARPAAPAAARPAAARPAAARPAAPAAAPLADDDQKILDPVALRQAALAAEAAGNPAAALDAWERVIDRCDATEDQRTEARARLRALRPQVPRNQDPAAARPWRTLVLIFRRLEFSWTDAQGRPQSIRSTVGPDDEQRIRTSIKAFGDHVFALSSGRLRIDAQVEIVEEPLTRLTPQDKAYWPAPWNVREVTDRLMKDRPFDSVFCYVKFKEGAGPAVPAPHMGGTFGGDLGPHGAGWTDVPWHATFPTDGEMELHEWLHQVDWMFSHVLDYPDDLVPTSDAGRMEGDDRPGGDPEYRRKKEERNWMGFYRHIMEDHVTRRMWSEAGMHDPPPTPWRGRWLHRWLVLGPLPDAPGRPAIETDAVGEATVRPRAGDAAAGRAWTALPPDAARVDLNQALGGAVNAAAYLATYVYSKESRDARLLVGSDDGVKAWVNGRPVLAKVGPRALQADEDQAPVRLEAGWNRVLLKVQQIGGGWLAQARLTDPAGKTLWDLRQADAPAE
jgi:hypothetical protein